MLTRPQDRPALPAIPVIETGADYALDTIAAAQDRFTALFAEATAHVPAAALRAADVVSRRWLVRRADPYLAEIDRVAARIGRPGAYFLSVNYEWGCTTGVRPAPDHGGSQLVRVLDWRTKGLGRHILAARIKAPAGEFVALTWAGYTGVLQAMAPGRFAAALNQAPMRAPMGLLALDWVANKRRVWRMPGLTPAHLLRRVFETARDFAAARRMLIDTPVCASAIFSLAGSRAGETAIIERQEDAARVLDGTATAANHWQSAGWRGRPRGFQSAERACRMAHLRASASGGFEWLAPPILNERTRLVMVAEPLTGHLAAQGYEADGPATEILRIA